MTPDLTGRCNWRLLLWESEEELASILLQLGGRNTIMLAACREENSFEITDLTVPLLEKELLTEIELSNFSEEETGRIIADLLPDNVEAKESLFEEGAGMEELSICLSKSETELCPRLET